MNGTPLPHEEPQLQNPPSGVVAYYWLKTRRGAAAEAGAAGWLGSGARLRRQRHAGAPGGYRDAERAGDLAAARAAAFGRCRNASLCAGRRRWTRRRRRIRTRRRAPRRCRTLHARGGAAEARRLLPSRSVDGGRGGRGGGGGGGGRGGAPTLAARPVHGAPDGGWPDLHPAGRREA